MELYILLAIHLLGASIWTGGHLVLAISVLPEALKKKSVETIQNFESRFERVGIPALILQVLTGLRLGTLVAPVSDWFQMKGLGLTVLVKLSLLLATVLLALDARLRIIPKLGPHNLKALAWHVIPVTIISILFILLGLSFRFGGI